MNIKTTIIDVPAFSPKRLIVESYRESVKHDLNARFANVAMSLCQMIEGKGAMAYTGHPSPSSHSSIVYLKPDRIEIYDGKSGYSILHFPENDKDVWGMKEIVTEFFVFFTQKADPFEKAEIYNRLVTTFRWDNKDKNGTKENCSLFRDNSGSFFGHPYTVKMISSKDVKEEVNSYTLNIPSRVREKIKTYHFIVSIPKENK